MSRSTDEWVAKSDDDAVPRRVRVRVFEAHGGRCYLSGRLIRPGEDWDLDHVIALINGGEHRESNLAPALKGPHKIKTKADVAEKSRVSRKRQKFIGVKKPRQITAWRRFNGEIVRAGRER